MATTIGDPSGQGPPPTGFHFYALDPLSAVARLVSSASVMLIVIIISRIVIDDLTSTDFVTLKPWLPTDHC